MDNSQKNGRSLLRRLSFGLIEWLSPEIAENVKGDLEEMYYRRLKRRGKLMAEIFLFWESITCLKLVRNRKGMYLFQFFDPNIHFKMSWRVLIKNRSYTLINVAGLSIGLIASLFIFLYVKTEHTYDQYHDQSHNIYRVVYDLTERNEKLPWAISKGKWARMISKEYAQVEGYVNITPTWGSKSLLKSETITDGLYENGFVWADPTLTSVFDFQFLAGNPETVLDDPNTIIISKSIAIKYFGDVNSAMGKTLNRDNETDYKVTGVYEQMPSNSHFHAELIASLMTGTTQEDRDKFWGYGYVLLNENADPLAVNESLPSLVKAHMPENSLLKIWLQPLEDIYLKSELMYEFEPVGNLTTTRLLSGVGVFILLIACFNFINLSTAYGSRRIKEIGIKKVLGAYRSNLVKQLVLESIIITTVAMVVASIGTYLLIPFVESLAGKSLDLTGILEYRFLLLVFGLAFLLGILAGGYPAFYLASLKPKKIFDKGHSRGKNLLRKSLTVFQFAMSITLIIGSLVIYKQLRYFQEKDMGMEPDQALVIPLDYSDNLGKNYRAFREELLRNPSINSMSMMSNLPGELIRMWTGDVRPANGTEEDAVRTKVFTTDYDFVRTLGLTITEGRDFSRHIVSDSSLSVLINKTAAHRLGFADLENAFISVKQKEHDLRVIGIVEDFHFASLHSEIEPLVIYNNPGPKGKLVVSLSTENLTSTLEYIGDTWKNYEPDRPLETFFLNEYFNQKYTNERNSMNLIISFTVLAVFIACLGLFGLATYVMHGRLKEVGIRKVFGASVVRLFTLLASEFVLLVLLAFVLISPLAYYLADLWLTDFAYRISIDFWIFGVAVLFVLLLALATVSYKSLYVAKTNPTKVLADE